MTAARLISPCREYAASYAEALREGLYLDDDGRDEALRVERDFDQWLHDLLDLTRPVKRPDGTEVKRVPATYFWLADDEKFLGAINLRHELSEHLMTFGGHIGYSVRASERRKGYGRLMLAGVLPKAKALGLPRVLVTCRDDNHGSIRIIESAGGVLENKVAVSFHPVPQRRYWIDLG